MKKLMIAGVVGLCAAVTFGIESANVVGYQNVTVNDSGFTLVTPTFKNVSGEQITLASIGGNLQAMESVQLWDADGGTESEYFYLDAANSMTGKAGWFENDFMTSADDVLITEGTSIAFQSQGTTELNFSGEVSREQSTIKSLSSGFTAIGNNTPSDVSLSTITFEGINAMDSIQFVDSDGATDAEYFYLDAANSMTGKAGWFENDFMTPADETKIFAGKGVLFQAANGIQVTIKIPSALPAL